MIKIILTQDKKIHSFYHIWDGLKIEQAIKDAEDYYPVVRIVPDNFRYDTPIVEKDIMSGKDISRYDIRVGDPDPITLVELDIAKEMMIAGINDHVTHWVLSKYDREAQLSILNLKLKATTDNNIDALELINQVDSFVNNAMDYYYLKKQDILSANNISELANITWNVWDDLQHTAVELKDIYNAVYGR